MHLSSPHAPVSFLPSLLRTLAVACAIAGVTLGASQGDPAEDGSAASQAIDETRAALEIDGQSVPWEEFACWLVRYQGEQHIADFMKARALERAAAADGIVVTPEELRAIVNATVNERIAMAFEGDREAWREELARLGSSEREFIATREEAALVDTWVERLVQPRRVIDEASSRAAWEELYGPGGRQLELALIQLKIPPASAGDSRTRDEATEAQRIARAKVEAEARALRARILAGEDFAALARSRSDDVESRAQGGRVGDLRNTLGWQAAVDQLHGLAVGEVSEPILVRGSWNLVRVEGESVTPFESVAESLRETLAAAPANADEADALLAELTGDVEVELLPELGREVVGRGSEPQSWRLERPVFLLDGQPVTRAAFAAWLTPNHGPALTRSFAETRIVERLGVDEGLAVSSAEVDRRVREDIEQRVERFFDGEHAKWRASIAARGISEEGFLRALSVKTRTDLLAERLILARRVVTSEMVRQLWQERYGVDGRSPDVRQLVMFFAEPAEGQVTNQEELEGYLESERQRLRGELQELRVRVANGEDFPTLVKLYSEDPDTRDRGGKPAGRFELHSWPQTVQAAISALGVGETTAPIELGNRFYLFDLVGLVVVTFEEVEDELRAELANSRPAMVEVAGFINGLYQEHKVRTLPGLFERQPAPTDRAVDR